MIRVAIASPQNRVVVDRALMRLAVRTVLRGEGIKERANQPGVRGRPDDSTPQPALLETQ